MSFTQPAYALPIVLDGTETIAIAFSAGLSTGYTATLTAGTYYNHRIVDADSLTKMIDDVLDAAEITAGNSSTWAESEPSTGLSFRMKLVRTGQTGDVISSMTIGSDTLRQAMGFSELVVDNITELQNAAPVGTLEGAFQRGYLWVPREILTRDERIPLAQVAGTITPVGRAVLDGYGQYERIRHVIEFVPGPLVYSDKAADADFQGVQVPGLFIEDDTAPLDQFWRLCREGADGAPPIIKYIADTDATAVTEEIVIADVAWLTDMENVAEETSSSPLLYRVRIEAMESVGTSFVSTGPTIGTSTPGELTAYDTYDDLPTDDNGLSGTHTDGLFAKVTTTDAAGAYMYVATMGAIHPSTMVEVTYTFDQWVPAKWGVRGLTYVVNSDGEPARASMGIGGDDKAALEARGWTATETSTGTVTDVSGDLELKGVASFDVGAMGFTPVAYAAIDNVLCITESDCTSVTASGLNDESLYSFFDGFIGCRLLQAAQGVKNQLGYGNLSTSIQLGHGKPVQSGFGRLFAEWEVGSTATAPSNEPGLNRCWVANDGWDPSISSCVMLDKKFAGASGTLAINIWVRPRAAGTAITLWREMHVVKVA